MLGRPQKALTADQRDSEVVHLQIELLSSREEANALRQELATARQLVQQAAQQSQITLQAFLGQGSTQLAVTAAVSELHLLRDKLLCTDITNRFATLLQFGSLQREYEQYEEFAPTLLSLVTRFIWNRTDRNHQRGAVTKAARVHHSRAKQISIHWTVARLIHELNQRAHPAILIAASIDAEYMHLNRPTWDLQAALGNLLPPSTVDSYLTAMVLHIPRTPFGRVTAVMFILLDNIDIYARRVFTRVEDGKVVKSQMEHGIVMEEFLVPESIMASAGPPPTNSLWKGSSTWDIMSCLPSLEDVHSKLTPVWQDHITAARAGAPLDVLARPPAAMDMQPSGRTWHRALSVMNDKHTNKADDMAAACEELEEMFPHISKCVHLDFQTWILSWWLALRNLQLYCLWLFIGGELHRQMHSNDACVSLWWVHVVAPIAVLLMRNDIKQKFYARGFNNRDHFFRVIGTIIYRWLVEIEVPLDLLYYPSHLMDRVKGNLPAWELIGCCFYGCTFSLRDKFCMRIADSPWLDWSWVYTSLLARGCNKTNYAKYGVFMSKVLEDCHPWVRAYLTFHRTYRKSDAKCTGVGSESCIEENVMDHKAPMQVNSQSRLEHVSKGLTAKRQIHRETRQYSHGPKSKPNEKRELMEEDIEFVVEELKSKVAANFKELLQPATYNKFSARSCNTHKMGTEMFLSVFGGLGPWLERLKAEYESERTFWKESDVMTELAAAAESAEADSVGAVAEESAPPDGQSHNRTVTHWLATHKPYRDTEDGLKAQAEDCLARAAAHRQRQEALAGRQAEQKKKAELEAEEEASKAAKRALTRAENSGLWRKS